MATRETNLFAALTADGQTSALSLPGDINIVDVFLGEGATYGSGTIKLQYSIDGSNYLDQTGASWTSGDGFLGRFLVFGRKLRFDLNGASSPDVTLQVNCRACSMSEVKSGYLTADGNVDVQFRQGPAAVLLWGDGNDGTGTLKLQYSVDGGTTYYDAGVSLTAAGAGVFSNVMGATHFRANLASSSSPTLAVRLFASEEAAGNDEAVGDSIVKITDSTTGTVSDTVNDTTAGQKDDVAALAAKINEIIDVLRAVGIVRQ